MSTSETTPTIEAARIEYQPLVRVRIDRGRVMPEDRESAMAFIAGLLAGAGFIYDDVGGEWLSPTHAASIVTSHFGCTGAHGTYGVEVWPHRLGESAVYHLLTGSYDAIPLAEKHRLSGSGWSLQRWLEEFDHCGKPRPR